MHEPAHHVTHTVLSLSFSFFASLPLTLSFSQIHADSEVSSETDGESYSQ